VAAGVLVKPTTITGNGLVFRSMNAGVTGTVQPIWPTAFGGTVADGTVTWRAVSQVTGEFQSLSPSAIIELFVLELNMLQHGVSDVYRFHSGSSLNNNGQVIWAGNSYLRFPVEVEGFEYNGNGQLPRPKFRVSNIFGTITAILTGLPSGLEGAKLTRIRTLARYLDAANFPDNTNPYGVPDSAAEFPREIYYVDRKAMESRDMVEFELAAAFDLTGVRAPKRQCIANICQWRYRSTECGYTAAGYYDENDQPVASAALDVCGKRLTSCEARFGVISRTGTVTLNSNVLTLSSTLGIFAGDPVRGVGVPTGATVLSVTNSTTLTMSSNSTATSTVVVNGTPSATAATMTVTSATGIAVGHTVTGTYMNNHTVTGISGTTLTLSGRPYSFTRSGVYDRNDGDDAIAITNTTGITVGMRVFGSLGINTTVSAVTAGVKIKITTPPSPVPFNGTTVFLYFMPASPTASSYTFSTTTPYAFRNPDAALPFGSFPGIGAYTT
jgi:lambda family phage minor tail protein L